MKIAFVFTQPPYGNSRSHEGLDALLAMAAYCDENELSVFFLNDGICNLLVQQQPDLILQKDTPAVFKLLDLYEIENRFVYQPDLERYQLNIQDLQLNCQPLDQKSFFATLQQAEKILTF
ncbi:sulfurtransferase complex subunit TusC [Mergibacter septicus]|uniref:sulfurtransferase complex subunit TusC n=1 Tax=Mergibacter septicus TaxID=221402 RepID=UPI00117947DF|nr:sulfurtransferase complex subunit TusC [Mergibacter septicus]AWX14468.1 sulfurtransferase complex subunit TusC [Mergibacter septicus]